MGLFTFAESPQLQALLSDIAPPAIRDASYSLYFTLAFGVGSLWVALYGFVIERLGAPTGVPVVFVLMAGAFVLAALGDPADPGRRARGGQRRLRGRPARSLTPTRPAGAGRWSPRTMPAIIRRLCSTSTRSGRGAAW